MAKRSKKLREADIFRARVIALRSIRHAGWTDWEADWLDSEAARSEDYIYTDNERVILNQLLTSVTAFTDYDGATVPDMLTIARRYIADLGEDDEEFVTELWIRNATTLMARQINRLANICRLSELMGRDERVGEVLREIRRRDDALRYEPGPNVPYA